MHTDKLSILLVEDNEDDYIIVRDLLRDIDPERFTLKWADSYADGLREIRGSPHDLILLDFRLPGGSGLGLLQETQALSGRAPVIFMTGQGDHDIDLQVMQAGAADYLVKDRLDADLLERAIRYAVERQRAAAALRASEDRYRTFVENSTEGIWRFELEQPLPIGRPEAEQIAHLNRYAYVAECNEAMARLYGFESASDILGARFEQFLSTGEASDDNFLRRLIQHQYRLVNAEAFGFDRHGQPKCVLHGLIGVVENGLLSRIWGSQVDITEQKRAGNAQAQLAAIVEASDDAISSQTLEGQIVTWNKAAEALYGYTAQEVTGQPVSLLTPSHIREEMARVQKRVGRGERVPQFETVRRHKDGRLIDVSLAISPIIDATGQVTGSSSIARDISEQKRAETRLRESQANMAAAQSIAHFGSWELELADRNDINANPLSWSDETFRIFGYEPGSVTATNDLFFRCVPTEDQPGIMQAVGAAVSQHQGYSLVHRIRRPDGAERIVRETAQYFEAGANGQPPRLVGTVHDITEQRRAEEHIRFQALLLSQVRNAVVATDLTGRIIHWNSFAEILYQWKAEEVIGRNVAEVSSPPGDQSAAARVMSEIQETGSWQGEWVARRKDGSTVDVFVVNSLFRDADGIVTGIVGVSVDITRRKQAEVLLTESRQRLALATESARIGIWDWDVAANEMFWDAQMYALYGTHEQGFSGAYDAWQTGLHPEDQDRTEAEIASALDGPGGFHTQFRVVWPGGEVRHIEAHATVLRADDGSAQRMIGVNWDITEREMAAESLVLRDKAIHASRNGIVVADMRRADCPLVSVNPAFERMTGYAAAEVLGRNCRFLQGPDADQPALAPIRAALEAGLPASAVLRNYRKDGTPFWNELFLSPIHDAEGTLTHYVGVQNDVTDRKVAEEERDRIEASLRQSEKRYRSVVAKVESLVIHDQGGRLIDVNQNACDSLGYTREELLRMRVQDYELNYEEASVGRLWEQMVSGEMDMVTVDGLHRRKDGSTFPVEVRVGLMETEGSLLMVAVARDVTERIKAQDALREAEQEQRQLAARLEAERARLAEAQAIAKVGSWEMDLLTDTLTWSDETHRIFGSDRVTFQNRYQDFLDFIHPDDRAAVDKAYTESVAEHTRYAVDHRIQSGDGSIKVVHERGQTFYDDVGRPLRSLGTVQDVTADHLMVEALRKSEHEFRRIIETTHEGVLQLDEDSKIIYANRRYSEMLGYTVEELLGRCPFDLMDEDSRVLAQGSFENRRAGTTEQFDRRFRHKDGSVVWGIVSASPILDEDGRMIGSFSMTTDITERKCLEAQVHQSEKLAALGELVAGVAHEINNPMAAILGNAELLEMHADPQVREDAQAIQRMSQRVTRIVRSLLTFARPSKEERRGEALNTLVEHTLEMTTYKLRTAGVSLALRLQDPSPVASANANEIQQILLNLTLNAEHALRRTEGEKRLVISTDTERTDDLDWATISVADNGCGIPEEIRTRIFDPFFTTKDVGEGTGLGLSICHGIAKAHGGRLSVESAVGLGTTFKLALPTPAAREEAQRPPSPSPDSSRSGEER